MNLATIRATDVTAPPAWAVLERQLIDLMERSAPVVMDHFYEASSTPYYTDDVDDLYERAYNWGLFYTIGGNDNILNLALNQWNGITRFWDDSYQSRVHNEFTPQIHNEYYNLGISHGAEWHHKGEGNQAFYHLCLADPTISENVRRARQFAALYIGEDPEAPNWDPKHKILRSPMQSSQGPQLKCDLDEVKFWLHGGHPKKHPDRWSRKSMGTRASLYPVVKDLDYAWYDDPQKAEEIVNLFNHVVLNGDIANNLCATALVTNAYLTTGDEKYKSWVLDYVDVWSERADANGGLIPDNVGPTGKTGELREGQFWGGLYGWNHYRGYGNLFHAVNTATECAHLLSRDMDYLALMRNQIKALLDASFRREDGQLMVPTSYGPEGWQYQGDSHNTKPTPAPMRMEEIAHLYHGSMSKEDYEIIAMVREGDVENDWNDSPVTGEKGNGEFERARFQYYDGKNPDWPFKALSADYQNVVQAFDKVMNDDRTPEMLIRDNPNIDNPIFTKALTQVTLGAPQTIYNGGLLRATVRYFDNVRQRPGLPRDVAALVDSLGPEHVGIHLVNLNTDQPRNLIVQAGAFCEHEFTSISYADSDSEKRVVVDSQYVTVELPPSTSIRMTLGMRRFVNNPSYIFPWHKDKIPTPFQ